MQISELEVMELLSAITHKKMQAKHSLEYRNDLSVQPDTVFEEPSAILNTVSISAAELLDGHPDLFSVLVADWSGEVDPQLTEALTDIQKFLALFSSELNQLNNKNSTKRDFVYPVI